MVVQFGRADVRPPCLPGQHGQDVDTAVADGRVLMHHRDVAHVDTAEILVAAAAETSQVLDRLDLRSLLAEPATLWGRARH